MLKNVSECLKPGGYFIGTIPDAYDIMRRQKAAASDTFGNDVFEIKFLSDPDDLPVFGAKYNFHLDGVVDCPEFLVYFPAFEKLPARTASAPSPTAARPSLVIIIDVFVAIEHLGA